MLLERNIIITIINIILNVLFFIKLKFSNKYNIN